jgi:hypothetical protein
MKVGRPVVAAAVDAGAVYLDSSGEPPSIRSDVVAVAADGSWPRCT